ncbi:MAG: hypothetical protein HY364_00475 [Candidatus Aenigmarchaeota archaeon]|nr:hypothetical protein [Candidatus Aenigmarchaeota archaeon]
MLSLNIETLVRAGWSMLIILLVMGLAMSIFLPNSDFLADKVTSLFRIIGR